MASTEKHEADVRRDRRDHTAPRRRYEALVEVGSASVGGFEAEAVDVSLDGMRVRTAYVPRDGERVHCRFDGYGGEITAEGEVTWTQREGRGGEFGVRFTGLDRRGMRILEDLCGPEAEMDEPSAPAPVSEDQPGTRVRLHISGLGSPMRARVRDGAPGEVLVGSNLEFLRVGRDLELENVERGRHRAARIEHVGVEIDPETDVPQLVVALSYADEEAAAAVREMQRREPPRERRPEPRREPARREPAPREAAPVRERRPEPAMTVRSEPVAPMDDEAYDDEAYDDEAYDDEAYDDDDLTTAPIRVRSPMESDRGEDITPEPQVIDSERGEAFTPSEMPDSRMAQVPATPPPADTDWAQKRRETRRARARAAEASEPMGEPLEGDVLEGELDEERASELEEEPSTNTPPIAKITRVAGQMKDRLEPGLAAASKGAKAAFGKVWGAVSAKRDAMRKDKADKDGPRRRTAPPPGKRHASSTRRAGLRKQHGEGVEADTEERASRPGGDRKRAIFSGAMGMLAVVGIYFASSSLQDDGAEAVADPALAAASASASGAAIAASASPVTNGGDPTATADVPLFGATPLSTTEAVPVPPQFEGSKDGGAPKPAEPKSFGDLQTSWGVGEVIEPNVFRLRMDGNIEGFVGKETEDGFKLVLPKRVSISTGAGLARKDKRVKEATVVNYPDRAEIIFTFHSEVPAFSTRAQGKRVIIEVGTKKAKKKKKKDKKK